MLRDYEITPAMLLRHLTVELRRTTIGDVNLILSGSLLLTLMSNLHGSIFALRAFVRPRLVVPGIKVDTIARLDFAALKKAGYTAAVFDRDNCLDAWDRCKSSFGEGNVVVVSNSAGTSDDPVGIQAESLSHNLGVPVLYHTRKKPACGEEILNYFRYRHPRVVRDQIQKSEPYVVSPSAPDNLLHQPSLNDPLDIILTPSQSQGISSSSHVGSTPTPPVTPRLLVVGDRLLTDVLLSNSLSSPPTHLAVWTTRLWKTPDLPLLRFLEQSLLRLVLWRRNQTFRDGVLEPRARGETWLGREGWIWWTRRWVLRTVRREQVPPEPIPSRTNDLARFVLPLPVAVVELPTTRLGWAWYYSKIGSRYAARGGWVALVWLWVKTQRAMGKAWAAGVRRIRERRAQKAGETSGAQPVQVKSQ